MLIKLGGEELRALLDLRTRLLNLGYCPIPTRSDNPKALAVGYKPNQICPEAAWKVGMGIAIALGRQRDDSFLVRFDIDGHYPEQIPDGVINLLRERNALPHHKVFMQRSTSGTGYDILLRVPRALAHNQPFFVEGIHAGELLCEGGHMSLTGEIVEGDLACLEMLEEKEIATILSILKPRHGNGSSATWKERGREGKSLIYGWDKVNTLRFRGKDGMPKAFKGNKPSHGFARSNWAKLREAKRGSRSDAYARYIQSLMLFATSAYGKTPEEKCITVAAIAIEDCAEHDEKGYDVEADTAAIIARILHGDHYKSGDGKFIIPYWASGYKPSVRQRGRPRGTQDTQLTRLRRLLLENAEGFRVDRLMIGRIQKRLTVEALAKQLKVSPRTTRRYLAVLAKRREISRDEVSGRNGRLVIVIRPRFGSQD